MLYMKKEITKPKMMSVGLHCRLIGRPGRIQSLKKFLEYVLKHDDVWICKSVLILLNIGLKIIQIYNFLNE